MLLFMFVLFGLVKRHPSTLQEARLGRFRHHMATRTLEFSSFACEGDHLEHQHREVPVHVITTRGFFKNLSIALLSWLLTRTCWKVVNFC